MENEQNHILESTHLSDDTTGAEADLALSFAEAIAAINLPS